MASQLFRVKSIDKLISDADRPEHRLQKTLGPWSLMALGIGAIIGSGIFVLTGTAAAGEYFQAPSILHALWHLRFKSALFESQFAVAVGLMHKGVGIRE